MATVSVVQSDWRICPILGVRDVVATLDYFTDQLGFGCDRPAQLYRAGPDGEAVYAIVTRGGASIHIQIRRGDLDRGNRESIETDAYIYVEDADALHDELVARGVDVFRGLLDEPYGMRDFTIETPDGLRIAFGSPLQP